MVGVRMIEANQLTTRLRRTPLRLTVILGAHEEAPPGPFLGRVRQGVRTGDDPISADERAAALVGVCLNAVAPDRVGKTGLKRERHYWTLPGDFSSQNRSD